MAYLCLEQALFHIFLFATAKQTRLEGRGEEKITDTAKTLDGMLTQLALTLGEHTVAQLADAEKRRGLISALRISSGPARRILVLLDNLETLSIEEQTGATEFLRSLPQEVKAIVTSRRRIMDGAVWVRLDELEWEGARNLIQEEMRRASNLETALRNAGEPRWQALYDATGGSPLALRWMLSLMRARNLSLDRALEILRSGVAVDLPLLQFIYREARQEMGLNDWLLLGGLSLSLIRLPLMRWSM